MIPLLLAGAFTMMKVVEHATSDHVHGGLDSATSVWVDVTGTGVYVAFAAVAGVNALVTVLLARRRELAVLRLAGATRARTLAVLIWEAGVVTVTGLMVAAAVAGAVLPPVVHAESGTWMPYPPAGQLAIVGLAAAVLVGLGTAVPAAIVLRRSPVESVAVAL
jgi:putative ABC transport system permease protein